MTESVMDTINDILKVRKDEGVKNVVKLSKETLALIENDKDFSALFDIIAENLHLRSLLGSELENSLVILKALFSFIENSHNSNYDKALDNAKTIIQEGFRLLQNHQSLTNEMDKL
jgi:hypothetical protein